MVSDTIFLKSNDSTRKLEKYLFISNLPTDKNTFWFCNTGTLGHIFKSDSILPANQGGRLSDYEALFFGCYVKQQGYFNDGKLMFKIETFYKTKIITNYYSSGQVKSIEQYYKDKKTGDWYFYKENGQIEKIETYKSDKLRRPKKNAL
jgi:antitoxin component YwqK of YwqJK toxin-antitoxin module